MSDDPGAFAYQAPTAPTASTPAPNPDQGVSAYHITRGSDPTVMGRAGSLKSARKVRDRLDRDFGASVHNVREHPSGRMRF